MDQSVQPEHFHEIVRRYSGYVYTIAYHLLGNSDDAEDAAQETFLKVYKRLADYDEAQKMRNWLCTITLNTARDFYRKSKRGGTIKSEKEVKELVDSYEESTIVHDRLDVIKMLSSLDIRYRSVVILFYIERYSIKEISGIIKKSENVVKVWLYRARKILMEQYGDSK